jgi:hypothetical protein
LLNRYVLKQPMDPVVRSSKVTLSAHLPIYNDTELLLPASLPLSVRVVSLPPEHLTKKKEDRHKILAMIACIRLHGLDLLSDRLLPLSWNDMEERLSSVVVTSFDQAIRNFPTTPEPDHVTREQALPTLRRVYIYRIVQENDRIEAARSMVNGGVYQLALVSECPLVEADSLSWVQGHREFGNVHISLRESPISCVCGDEERKLLTDMFELLLNERWRRRTRPFRFRMKPCNSDSKAPLFPACYLAYLDPAGSVAWDRMRFLVVESRRTREERLDAVVNASTNGSLPHPRIWLPLYDELQEYVVSGPSEQTCGDPNAINPEETYQEFFAKRWNYDVSPSETMVCAKDVWHFPKAIRPPLPPGSSPHPTSLESRARGEMWPLRLPSCACIEAVLADSTVVLDAVLLPQILYSLELRRTAYAFIAHCETKLPVLAGCLQEIASSNIKYIEIMLTAASCRLSTSFEKLEWLGDAVLKLMVTDSLIHSKDLKGWIRYLHEGYLSTSRGGKLDNRPQRS